ncbi:MAG: hypothetical protein GXP62_16910 [Oligoflexia bacterium]|nr:hypothetical protein [Oligoflexia bacterium]
MRSLKYFSGTMALVAGAMLVIGTLASTPAYAAKSTKVYVNGTDATGMKDFEFTAVDVRIDSNGDVWIDAPRYRIEVTRPATSEPATSAPQTAAPVAVASGQHWLVTQDQGSVGQVVDVLINGTSVREIRSGQAQLILDIGPFLMPGSNVVTFRPVFSDIPAQGALTIHLGEGSNDDGTLKMQNPQISYARNGGEPTGEKAVEYVVK